MATSSSRLASGGHSSVDTISCKQPDSNDNDDIGGGKDEPILDDDDILDVMESRDRLADIQSVSFFARRSRRRVRCVQMFVYIMPDMGHTTLVNCRTHARALIWRRHVAVRVPHARAPIMPLH
jgi:hypothetical protein